MTITRVVDEDMIEYEHSEDPVTLQEDSEDNGQEVQSDPRPKYPMFNPKSDLPILDLGTNYIDSKQFKKAIISYAVHEKRDLYWKKNESMYVRAECKGTGCPFFCSAGWENRDLCFQVKAVNLVHRCNCKFSLKIVSSKWLAEKFEDKFREDPCLGFTQLKEDIKAQLNLNVSKSKARRTKDAILGKLGAGYAGQFKRLRDYAQECLNSNPGSTVIIKTNSIVDGAPLLFQRIYVCFGAMKMGFLDGCRRVIGLDGCFLKGMLKGEILTAVGRDANNQMYPIAWAIVEIENTSSWRWFLELLKGDLEITNNSQWTLMSDQQKGLSNVIAELFPGIEHRNCARHIHANWSKRHKGKVLKLHFWRVAKSTTESELQQHLQALDKVDSSARADLEKYPLRLLCKTYFRTNVKCDIVHNNLSEAFNSTLLEARSKPIILMLEDIRKDAMKRIATKRAAVEKWSGNYGSLIMKKLDANILDCVAWKVIFNGDDGYEVKKMDLQYKVKLEARTCSCRSWDLTGIPCPHAICAIYESKKQPEDYIDDCYSKATYLKTYSHVIQPMNGEMDWPHTQGAEIHPPKLKKMTGRPKRKRKPEEDEPRSSQSTTHLSRIGRIMTCKTCRQQGHNKRYCPTANVGIEAENGGRRVGRGGRGSGNTGRRSGNGRGSTSTRRGTGSAERGRGIVARGRGSSMGIGIYTNPHTGEVT